jgi:superfamily II DNA or RNA helicase
MIQLRPYQTDVKQKIFNAWNSGYNNVLLVLPTGSGKTKCFCSLIIDTLNDQSVSLPTAIMVHRKELVQQICLTLAEENISHNIIKQIGSNNLEFLKFLLC